MQSLQSIQKEVIANFFENKENYNQKSKNELCDNKLRIILMAIEIERLHGILNSKIDYYNQKMQDYIKRGQNNMQTLELFYKGQITEYLQRNTELNQQIIEKNALMSQNIKENSQQEMNMFITQQCLQFEQELQASQLRNIQLQQENQKLRTEFEDAPELRKKLYDLEQLYSQLIIEKNEEIKQLRQNNQELSPLNSQIETLNQLIQKKEQEFLEWQFSSQQTYLIHENQRLKKELKFLNDKLNLLLIDNDHLRNKKDDFQNKNYYQITHKTQAQSKNDQNNQTPRKQQRNQINPKLNQLLNRSNTPSNQIKPQSQPQQDNQNNNLFNQLIEQILHIQNQKIQSIQSIQNQISLLSRVQNMKQQEISQLFFQQKYQNKLLIKNLSNNLINQKLSAQLIHYPQLKYYSVSPNNIYSQPFAIQQIHNKSPLKYQYKRIKTETTLLSYPQVVQQQINPIVIQPQNIVTYNQAQPHIHYHYSPIQKTVAKQNCPNSPYIERGFYPNEATQFCNPFKINVNQPNLRIFEQQELNHSENVYQPECNIYTSEFQVNSLDNNERSNQLNIQNQNITNQKQKSHLARSLDHNVSYSNDNKQQEEQIVYNKITLQDPVSIMNQRQNGQQESEVNLQVITNLQQFQDFRSNYNQKLQREQQLFQNTYSNALDQLQKLENNLIALINEKSQQIQHQRGNKFNRIYNEKIMNLDIQKEYQSYKIEQPNSDQQQIEKQQHNLEKNEFLQQQIVLQKKLLNEQQVHFMQLISLQDEILYQYEPLVSLLIQKESELITIQSDLQNLTSTIQQQQSEQITPLQQQKNLLQKQLVDCTNQLKDIQFKLKLEQDQHNQTKQIIQSLLLEANNYQIQIVEIQNRNSYLEKEINRAEQVIYENQIKKQQLSHDKDIQTIDLKQQQSTLSNDQIEIENLKQKLYFEQEITNQLNDTTAVLQQQIQTQEQLLQKQKLNNSKQFEEIKNLTKEKIEIQQQLQQFQVKYISLQEQFEQIQGQQDNNQNIQQYLDINKNLNFQIDDLKQLNEFLSNQITQQQQNSEIQISAQNTVLSSKIAHLEKQLSLEKQLKEQANNKILQLEKQLQGLQDDLQQQDETSDLKDQIFQLANQYQLLQQQNENLIETFQLEINQLKQKINELTNQNQSYQEQIKDFETKQLLDLQSQKKFANQINQQQQQLVLLQQENHQYHNDLQQLRQNLKLDIQDFEDYQNNQIYDLKKQIDELNLHIQNQQKDISYLQSQIQFEQREKNIIIQNKIIQDELIQQIQEENTQLYNLTQNQQNDIEYLSKQIRQSNQSIQNESFTQKEQMQNQNESNILDNQQLKLENQTLIQECQKLKDALNQITEEKNKLEMIFNYQNQIQEAQFQEIQQSSSIINSEKQDQVNNGGFLNQQYQIKDLNIKFSESLLKLNEFDDLIVKNEQIKQDLQNQIQKLNQQIIYIQQLRKNQKEQHKNKDSFQQQSPSTLYKQQIDELIQKIQILIISNRDYLQLNSKIIMIIKELKQLLKETKNLIASFQSFNSTFIRDGNVKQQEKYSTDQTDYQEQCKQLVIENDKLDQKANQYQHLLIQLQDEYYKQGSALDKITKEYQQIINKDEFKVIKLIHYEQLNDKINDQKRQIDGYLNQIQNQQHYFNQEQRKNLEEITRLNNQIEEIQKQIDNQEFIKLKQEILNLQSQLQKQNYYEDLVEQQKLLQKQNQEEQTQLKQESQRLYQRVLQISNSYNLLKEEKEQDLQRYQKDCKQIQESLEKLKNENIQYKIYIDRLQKLLQEQKNQIESNLQQELKKLQSKLDSSLQQQKLFSDDKSRLQSQVQQQQEQLSNQFNTINQLKKEVQKKEQIIIQLSQQNNIQSSQVQEVTFLDDSKNSSSIEFMIKQLQNENLHLNQLLIDMENDYSHKIKLQQIQIQGLNDKLREIVYDQTKKNPIEDEFLINNYQNH